MKINLEFSYWGNYLGLKGIWRMANDSRDNNIVLQTLFPLKHLLLWYSYNAPQLCFNMYFTLDNYLVLFKGS